MYRWIKWGSPMWCAPAVLTCPSLMSPAPGSPPHRSCWWMMITRSSTCEGVSTANSLTTSMVDWGNYSYWHWPRGVCPLPTLSQPPWLTEETTHTGTDLEGCVHCQLSHNLHGWLRKTTHTGTDLEGCVHCQLSQKVMNMHAHESTSANENGDWLLCTITIWKDLKQKWSNVHGFSFINLKNMVSGTWTANKHNRVQPFSNRLSVSTLISWINSNWPLIVPPLVTIYIANRSLLRHTFFTNFYMI